MRGSCLTLHVALVTSIGMSPHYETHPHVASNGELWHWANRGELPAVFAFIFLLLAAYGGGQFSIDGWRRGS